MSNQPHNTVIRLSDLSKNWPKIAPGIGGAFAEAASLCFEKNGHYDEVNLSTKGLSNTVYQVHCLEVTDAIRSSHDDLVVAAEWGAYGIAIILISKMTDYRFVKRSAKGTGFDLWLGDKNDPLFQEKARLEVSGTLAGGHAVLKQRIREKLMQMAPSDNTGLPGFAIVVEFSIPISQVERK